MGNKNDCQKLFGFENIGPTHLLKLTQSDVNVMLQTRKELATFAHNIDAKTIDY